MVARSGAIGTVGGRRSSIGPRGDWLDNSIGSVNDVEGFKEELRLGREYRISDRAADKGR